MSAEGYIYLIQSLDGGPLYLGHARDPKHRLASHQGSSPVRLALVGSRPGARAEESRLHKRLAPIRVRGSWYPDCALVRAVLGEDDVPDPNLLVGDALAATMEAFLRDAARERILKLIAEELTDSGLDAPTKQRLALRVADGVQAHIAECYVEWRDRLLSVSDERPRFMKVWADFCEALECGSDAGAEGMKAA